MRPCDKLGNRMLAGPLRDFVIKELKDPLNEMIIITAGKFLSKFGGIKKEDLSHHNSFVLLEIFDDLLEHYINPNRKPLVKAGTTIIKYEYEHDAHWRWLMDKVLAELVEAVNSGKFLLDTEPIGNKGCWKD